MTLRALDLARAWVLASPQPKFSTEPPLPVSKRPGPRAPYGEGMKVQNLLAVVTVAVVTLGTPAPASGQGPEPLPRGTDVDYQLGGAAEPADNVGIVVRDRNASPVAGRYNICYVNGFQTQPDERAFWRHRTGPRAARRRPPRGRRSLG